MIKRKYVCYWHFVNWYCFSLGIAVDIKSPNLEIHLPFGFIRIGWQQCFDQEVSFLERCVIDIDKRLQGVEEYIAKERIEREIIK